MLVLDKLIPYPWLIAFILSVNVIKWRSAPIRTGQSKTGELFKEQTGQQPVPSPVSLVRLVSFFPSMTPDSLPSNDCIFTCVAKLLCLYFYTASSGISATYMSRHNVKYQCVSPLNAKAISCRSCRVSICMKVYCSERISACWILPSGALSERTATLINPPHRRTQKDATAAFWKL